MRVSIFGQVVTELSRVQFLPEDGRAVLTTPDGKVIQLCVILKEYVNRVMHTAHDNLMKSGFTEFSAAHWEVLTSDLDIETPLSSTTGRTSHFGE